MVQLVGTLSPRRGLTRLGKSFELFLSVSRKSCAVNSSLYGEFLSSSWAFFCAACSARKFKVAERVSFFKLQAVEERKFRVHALSQRHVAQLVRQNGREARLVRKHIH